MNTVLISNCVLLTLLVITALLIFRIRDLFAAIVITGVFSLLSACVFLNMYAVDVSLTEASVGAGVATLLFIVTLQKVGREDVPTKATNIVPLIIVIITGMTIIYGIQDIVPFGMIESPVHEYVNPRYIEQSPEEIGIPNMVTSVLASYRGFDTFGEVTVIFTAGAIVFMLLGMNRGKE